MTQPTTAPHRRMSLSKDRLLKTELGIIHLLGDSKLEVYEKATAHADDDMHPISHFAHHDQFSLWFAPCAAVIRCRISSGFLTSILLMIC